MTTIEFDQEDAWIFWSIPANESGTDLRGLISAADALNHAIPSREQIELSIDRGLQAGVIELDGSCFRFALYLRDDITSAYSVSKTWFKQLDALFEYIASRKWGHAGTAGYRLPEKEYEAVVEEYLRSFKT
jgi:hypothetical protein